MGEISLKSRLPKMRYAISRNGVFFLFNWLLLCQIAIFQHVGIKEKLKVVCTRDYFSAATLNLCARPTSCLFSSLAKLSPPYRLSSGGSAERQARGARVCFYRAGAAASRQ